MTTSKIRRWSDEFWTVPRAAAVVLVVVAIGAFIFLVHFPYSATTPEYGPAQDRIYALRTATYVYDVVEAGPQRTGLPVPVAHTAAIMEKSFRRDDTAASVTVHGAHIMVTFPKKFVVCVWVPVIVEGPKEPRIVAC